MRFCKQLAWWAAIGIGMVSGVQAQPWPDDAALMKSAESLHPGDVVPNSYIVSFVPSAPGRPSPVLPAQAHEHGNVPFGEHSTGQDKDALAETLGLRPGQVLHIYDSFNAIHVQMDADQAEVLRQDPRVLSIEADRVLSAESIDGPMPPGVQDDVALMKSAESLRPGDVVPNSYIVSFVPTTPERPSPVVSAQEYEDRYGKSPTPIPFGEHSTGQDKAALAQTLGLQRGRVHRIYDRFNAVHVLMDADEAEALRQDPRVLSVEADRVLSPAAVQVNPGWGLDRLDQNSTALNNQYTYTYNGAGQTIYVLDTGLNLGNPQVAAEFGGRASILFDFNGGNGYDCHGHGTQVASAAASNRYGTAKGANVMMVKVTGGCTGSSITSATATSFNWLAQNAARGSIANYSLARTNGNGGCNPIYDTELDNAVKAAYNRGVIVVAAAGNDGCNVNNFPVSRLPEAFVVGATSPSRLVYNQDARAVFFNWSSRYGSNVAGFAPGAEVPVLNHNGTQVISGGTSMAAPYVAGLFASGCQLLGTACQTAANPGQIYQALKNIATMGSVVEPNGGALPASTPSRFLNRNTW